MNRFFKNVRRAILKNFDMFNSLTFKDLHLLDLKQILILQIFFFLANIVLIILGIYYVRKNEAIGISFIFMPFLIFLLALYFEKKSK